jgi:type IV pilus assembly protein PilA
LVPENQEGDLMSYTNRISALAAVCVSLSSYAGAPAENAAVAEALAQLESAKILVTQAYVSNHGVFPPTAYSPLPRSLGGTRYVKYITYNSVGSTSASVVLTVDGTGNPILDRKFIGMFAMGQQDGTVKWMCGTAAAATSAAPSAVSPEYQYLPPECQH